jgi:hypothetical protein
VIDTGNNAARKFSGRASEANKPPSFPEMISASTPMEPGAERIVALCVFAVNRVAVQRQITVGAFRRARPSPDRRKMMALPKSL